jgi:methylenetetrahydrofolate--tRNA-(uracil-5-)-methyltransferase
VFRTIPGLEGAEILRYGSIHRNSYLNSPACLTPWLALKNAAATFVAGQLTGVEGYTESLGTGLLAGLNLARALRGLEPLVPPPATMLGALVAYLRDADPERFQPMNANFGLLPPLERMVRDRAKRKGALAERALAAMRDFAGELLA